jgi:hypothetical protein
MEPTYQISFALQPLLYGPLVGVKHLQYPVADIPSHVRLLRTSRGHSTVGCQRFSWRGRRRLFQILYFRCNRDLGAVQMKQEQSLMNLRFVCKSKVKFWIPSFPIKNALTTLARWRSRIPYMIREMPTPWEYEKVQLNENANWTMPLKLPAYIWFETARISVAVSWLLTLSHTAV